MHRSLVLVASSLLPLASSLACLPEPPGVDLVGPRITQSSLTPRESVAHLAHLLLDTTHGGFPVVKQLDDVTHEVAYGLLTRCVLAEARVGGWPLTSHTRRPSHSKTSQKAHVNKWRIRS